MNKSLFVALLLASLESVSAGSFGPINPNMVYMFSPTEIPKGELELTETDIADPEEYDHRDAFIIPEGDDLKRFLEAVKKADIKTLSNNQRDFFEEDETGSETDSESERGSSEFETITLSSKEPSIDSTRNTEESRESSLWSRFRSSASTRKSLIFSPLPDKPEALNEAPPVQVRAEYPALFVKVVSGLGYDPSNRGNLMIEPILDFVYSCAKYGRDLPALPHSYKGEHWEHAGNGQEHLHSGKFEVRGAERVRIMGEFYTVLLKKYQAEWDRLSEKLDALIEAAQKRKAKCESRILPRFAEADYEKYEQLVQQAVKITAEMERLRVPIAKLKEIVNGPFLPSQFQKAVYDQFSAPIGQ